QDRRKGIHVSRHRSSLGLRPRSQEFSRGQSRSFDCPDSVREQIGTNLTAHFQNANNDRLLSPILCSVDSIGPVIERVLTLAHGESNIDPIEWEKGRYCPTPTIIEAALALYKGHSVLEISRSPASGSHAVGDTFHVRMRAPAP